jgi:hypothetical protein
MIWYKSTRPVLRDCRLQNLSMSLPTNRTTPNRSEALTAQVRTFGLPTSG